MARSMVINYGFSEIGPFSLLDPSAQVRRRLAGAAALRPHFMLAQLVVCAFACVVLGGPAAHAAGPPPHPLAADTFLTRAIPAPPACLCLPPHRAKT